MVQALETRLRHCEDQLALYQLIMTYGPAVDSGSSEVASRLWTEEGLYDAQVGSWSGRQAIAGMIEGSAHQALIHGGAAHVAAMPLLSIEEDTAFATCYFHLYVRDGDGFRPWQRDRHSVGVRAPARRVAHHQSGEPPAGWRSGSTPSSWPEESNSAAAPPLRPTGGTGLQGVRPDSRHRSWAITVEPWSGSASRDVASQAMTAPMASGGAPVEWSRPSDTDWLRSVLT